MDPAGPVAAGQKGMAIMVFVVAAVVFAIVISALLYCIIRFRDRPGAPEASQLHGNSRLELAWTIVPSVLLVVILVATLTTMFNLATAPKSVPLDYRYCGQPPVVVGVRL